MYKEVIPYFFCVAMLNGKSKHLFVASNARRMYQYYIGVNEMLSDTFPSAHALMSM